MVGRGRGEGEDALHPDHDVVVGGGLSATVDLGSGPVHSNGGSDAFAADRAP